MQTNRTTKRNKRPNRGKEVEAMQRAESRRQSVLLRRRRSLKSVSVSP